MKSWKLVKQVLATGVKKECCWCRHVDLKIFTVSGSDEVVEQLVNNGYFHGQSEGSGTSCGRVNSE